MNLIYWNCQGLGNRQTIQELGDLVRAQDPSVVFLAETWLEEGRLSNICGSLQFGHYHGVLRITCGGGLALFWKIGLTLDVESSSPNHIDAVINKEKDNAWRFTRVYGAPETQLRSATWDLIRSLHRRGTLPWPYGGDFNEILKSHEKRGGRLRPYSQMEQFREVLDKCNLLDLGFLGNKLTWSRTYPNGGMVWERLDRAVCTTEWYDLFLSTSVQTLTCVSSDHNPICIQLEEIEVKTLRPWQFEQMWLKDSGCKETVERT